MALEVGAHPGGVAARPWQHVSNRRRHRGASQSSHTRHNGAAPAGYNSARWSCAKIAQSCAIGGTDHYDPVRDRQLVADESTARSGRDDAVRINIVVRVDQSTKPTIGWSKERKRADVPLHATRPTPGRTRHWPKAEPDVRQVCRRLESSSTVSKTKLGESSTEAKQKRNFASKRAISDQPDQELAFAISG
jgi:hypothetical protein